MSVLQIAGVVVMGVGVLLVLLGIVFSWREFQGSRTLGPTEFVEALAKLVKAIAHSNQSVVCFTFGVLLIFLGGLTAGVSGFVN